MGATTGRRVRSRWWQRADLTVEGQAAAFREAELDFTLDQGLLEAADVVAFNGDLRFEDRRVPARVIYPPGFDLGEHPVVVAPNLEVGRHRTPSGLLCLDHVVRGESEPMSGVEAVERAKRLWALWETDQAQLAEEEAPDPRANYIEHTAGTALSMVDVDVTGYSRGYVHFGLTSLHPMRGAVHRVRATHPTPSELDISDRANGVLRGDFEVTGPWVRLAAPPAVSNGHEIVRWLETEHRALVERATRAATGLRDEQPQMPALAGFVYPDEGPGHGESHDAWLFVAVRPDGQVELPRPFSITTRERWLRQPQLEPLADSKVAIVGVGALGSQVADLLGRAGVGEFVLVDNDLVMPGNRVRNELDLGDLGQPKTVAVAERIRRANPWAEVTIREARVGTPFLGGGHFRSMQRLDDELAELLGGCDIVVNATASSNASSYLSLIVAESGIPVVHAYVSAGAWGARVLVQRPGESACWDCLAWWQTKSAGEDGASAMVVPPVAEEHADDVVVERGCADPTFTGPGFELAAAAAAVGRVAVGVVLDGDGYPAPDFDLATLTFRGGDDQRSSAQYMRLPVHERCTTCRR